MEIGQSWKWMKDALSLSDSPGEEPEPHPETFTRFCVDCAHIRPDATLAPEWDRRDVYAYCAVSRPNPVTGSPTTRCMDSRSSIFRCGPSARWFKPKPKPKVKPVLPDLTVNEEEFFKP